MFAFLVAAVELARGQDRHFEFHSPFGSDATNQPGLDPRVRTSFVFEHVWSSYQVARTGIGRPLPKASLEDSQKEMDRDMMTLRYGQLLETMVELRAFATQHGYDKDVTIEAELSRIDPVLRSLHLFYDGKGGQGMVDFCARLGLKRIRASVKPVLFDDAGWPRSLPEPSSTFPAG